MPSILCLIFLLFSIRDTTNNGADLDFSSSLAWGPNSIACLMTDEGCWTDGKGRTDGKRKRLSSNTVDYSCIKEWISFPILRKTFFEMNVYYRI